MDTVALLVGLFGGGSIIGFLQYLITRHDTRRTDIAAIKRDLSTIRKSQNDMAVRVTRMELMTLLRNDPDNKDAILAVAEHYFIELDGNAYVHAMFEKWAKEHDVPVGWLPGLHKRERKSNGK